MKLQAIVLSLLLLFSFPIPSQAVGKVVGPGCFFTWDANTETDLEGYKLYVGNTSGIYGPAFDVGLITTYTCNAAGVETAEGQYYVVVSAYDLAGNEGLQSEEVPFVFDSTSPAKVIGLGVVKK